MAGIKKMYTPEFKKKMVKLVLEEGRQMKSVNQEYNLGEGSLRKQIREYSEECEINPELNNEKDLMAENLKLHKQLAEAKKENDFLKKAAAFFAKELDQKDINSLKFIIRSIVAQLSRQKSKIFIMN